MGSAFEDSGKRDVAARDGEDLRIAPRGEDGEAVADHRHDETSDPEPEPDPDRGGQRSIDDGERTRRAGEQDRFGERAMRSEEHTSELQSLMRISYAVFCLKKKQTKTTDL